MRIFLLPLSFVFRLLVFFRNKMYDWGIIKQVELNAKVISVGNISAGGTGKTPFTELIAKYIIKAGKFPVIVQKGFKRESDDLKVAELNFRNENQQLNSENFGDEGLLLLENLNDTPGGKGLLVICDKKSTAAKFADAKFKPDVIIIDDGFQHRKLARQLDIVLVNETKNTFMLPAGNYREPHSAIYRADIVVVNEKFNGSQFILKTKSKPKVTCNYELDEFVDIKGQVMGTVNAGVTAFCGIADPDSFRMLLVKQNIKINGFLNFPDHHYFTQEEIRKIISAFQNKSSSTLITTQKDMVRLKNSELVLKSSSDNLYKELLYNYPLYYAKIKMQISNNAQILFDKIDNLLKLP